MRIDYIDGLRGFFALLVVYIHYSALFYVTLPTGFYNSCEMVCGFFVLSGFVLSCRFWQSRDLNLLTSAAVRRYIRLTFAPLVSILLAWFLMKEGLIFNREVCALTKANEFMPLFFNFPVHLSAAFKEGLWNIYFDYNQINSYNPVLWTMSWELKGSFLSFAFLALFGNFKNRGWIYLIFIALTFKTLYLTFVFGIMFADMLYSQEGKKCREFLKDKKIFSWILLLAGLFLLFYALNYHSVYDKMNFAFFAEHQMSAEDFYHILSSVMIIYAVIQLEVLQKIFDCKFFKLVGKYSFSLYVIHIPIMFSIGGIVFLKLFQAGYSSGFCIFAGTVASLLAIIPATFLLHNDVDMPAGKLAKRFEKIFR